MASGGISEEDDLLDLGDGVTNESKAGNDDLDEEMLLLSSPSPPRQSSKKIDSDEELDLIAADDGVCQNLNINKDLKPDGSGSVLDETSQKAEGSYPVNSNVSDVEEREEKHENEIDLNSDDGALEPGEKLSNENIDLDDENDDKLEEREIDLLDESESVEMIPSSSIKEQTSELEIIDGSDSELEEGSELASGDSDELEASSPSAVVLDDSDCVVEEVDVSLQEGKIHIHFSNGALFIWNAEDAQMLREECRIVGKLTGCLPRAPRQNNHLGLPLQLLPEEAKLLVDIDAAVVVEEEAPSMQTLQTRAEAFTSVREDNYKIQQNLFKENRKVEISQRLAQIKEGKKAKKRKLEEQRKFITSVAKEKDAKLDISPGQGEDKEKEEKADDSRNEEKRNEKCDESPQKEGEEEDKSCDEEGNKKEATEEQEENEEEDETDNLTVEDIATTETNIKHSLVQIFTENPWKRSVKACLRWRFPCTEKDTIRYSVFKDLWKKGYYLTSGTKFGGDFLVYPGDPCRFHSHFIAVCQALSHEMCVQDLVAMGRLSSNTRKTTLLCSLIHGGKVSYTSLNWTGIS